jgi:hypothetical protein
LSFSSLLLKHLEAMVELLRAEERKTREPDYDYIEHEPLPRKVIKSPHEPGSMEWFKSLPPPPDIMDEIKSGRAISANMMRPTPRPPRAPGQQRRRSTGRWFHWA